MPTRAVSVGERVPIAAAVVSASMVRMRTDDLKVLGPVIRAVSVDVMRHLGRLQWPSDLVCEDDPSPVHLPSLAVIHVPAAAVELDGTRHWARWHMAADVSPLESSDALPAAAAAERKFQPTSVGLACGGAIASPSPLTVAVFRVTTELTSALHAGLGCHSSRLLPSLDTLPLVSLPAIWSAHICRRSMTLGPHPRGG